MTVRPLYAYYLLTSFMYLIRCSSGIRKSIPEQQFGDSWPRSGIWTYTRTHNSASLDILDCYATCPHSVKSSQTSGSACAQQQSSSLLPSEPRMRLLSSRIAKWAPFTGQCTRSDEMVMTAPPEARWLLDLFRSAS